ncbi:glycosyltransferase family 25 protein [Acinetobacter towneri]|uniref:glycosyltransferase family 25 protein n=1 Tax=Acinetobacter towneri TaxID=202956 RepID=UPI001AA07647|nr:glycosyltransferase family 25 protein [Acinetobacter towneri]QTD64341.1 glycosyltransferase family 25 protein [Acinetobacter towneri]
MNNFPIYLVSLEKDGERRTILEKKFSKNYSQFKHINAVDGRLLSARDYFLEIQPYFKINKKLMSPAELGCTLSHIEAIKCFIESGSERALILEDDVIGDDTSLEIIKAIAKNIPENSVLICGGQDGLNTKYLFGRYSKEKKIYELAKFSYAHIFRTCCYVITRKSALAILNYQINHKTLADKWDRFFSNTDIKIMYRNVMSHPIDLSHSHIESERVLSDVNKLDKLLSVEVVSKILNKVRNFLYYTLYKILPLWKNLK